MTIDEETIRPVPDFYKYIAPHLLECDFPKKIAALQAFCNPEEGEKFHLLLVGDPSSGKSELLKWITRMCPNSGYVGQRTTPAGLEEEFEYVDTGILGVEEFDKINKNIHRYLLEMMEDQQVKITTKWGRRIVKARTNVFAVCNPRNHMLNEMEPVHLQLSFSDNPTLLSRFAMILPFKALGGDRYGDIAVSGNTDRDEVTDALGILKKLLVKARRAVPKVHIDNEMARQAGDWVGGELKRYSPMRDILTPRAVNMGFLTALRARARMNIRDVPNKSDYEYIKRIFEEVYFPEGSR